MDTFEKLAEAVFFFNALRLSISQNGTESGYYLSAFVNAARSVTYIMQKEYSKKSGFDVWWSKNTPKRFQNFNDLRVVIFHQSSVKKTNYLSLDFGEGLIVPGGGTVTTELINLREPFLKKELKIEIQSADGTKRPETHIQKRDLTIEAYYEKGKKEIKFDAFLDEGESYLNELVRLVEECANKFNN